MATVSSDGAPQIVPITFAVDGGFLFTMVDQKPKTTTSLQRLRNVEANPAVSLIVDHYDDEWTKLWWVRFDGDAAVERSGSDWSLARRLLAAKYRHYSEQPPEGPAIVVAIERTTWWEWPQ
jgi:PPOX class probable F420-dependent enzyme